MIAICASSTFISTADAPLENQQDRFQAQSLPSEPASTQPASTQPAPAQSINDASLLAGPSLTDAAMPTLVKREFNGSLIHIEPRPEAAAVELLGLTQAERAAVDAVLVKRFADVLKTTLDNYQLFVQLQSERQGTGQAAEKAKLFMFYMNFAAQRDLYSTPAYRRWCVMPCRRRSLNSSINW